MSRIFISYKRVDKDKVFKIKNQIESALGEKCWIDIDGIESDSQFASVIIDAIDRAEVVLFMHSKEHSLITDFENDWTVRELNYAEEENKRIVFINIDNTPLFKWFKFMFPRKQLVNGTSTEDIDHLCKDLANWLSINVYNYYNYSLEDISKGIPNKRTEELKIQVFDVGDVFFKMIYVEGGKFSMGATPEMKDPGSQECPAHEVTLSSFYIGITPVTQKLWKAVMGTNPSEFQGAAHPVEMVTWNNCQEFINELNKKTGRKFRLPTEAEWEFVARGGIKSLHTQYSGSNTIDNVAWYGQNSGCKGTLPVAIKKHNELGVFDMCGNVSEWCQDWYGEYNDTPQTNPIGSSCGSRKVYRNGCWQDGAWKCRISSRDSHEPNICSNGIGFRLALSD